MKKCSYSTSRMPIFLDEIRRWQKGKGSIPLPYLQACKICRDDIEEALEKDICEFNNIKKEIFSPRYATQRIMAAVYRTIEIPEGISEEDAIIEVRKLLKESGYPVRFCLNYPQIKTVYVEQYGSVHTVWYPPEVKWTETHLFISGDGKSIGKSFI